MIFLTPHKMNFKEMQNSLFCAIEGRFMEMKETNDPEIYRYLLDQNNSILIIIEDKENEPWNSMDSLVEKFIKVGLNITKKFPKVILSRYLNKSLIEWESTLEDLKEYLVIIGEILDEN